MIAIAHVWLPGVGFALAAGAMVYSIVAWFAVRKPLPSLPNISTDLPPLTVLKPLCGAEPETYSCLKSFCTQAYPDYQVLFGVCDPHDPAVALVERLQRELPGRDIGLVVERQQHGSNRKVSNLINMMPFARHDFLVLSDSDVRAAPDYLSRVVVPLLDAKVGIVTCCYRGTADGGIWSLLGALFINDWFLPSVRMAAAAGSRAFAFGATIAIRRDALCAIGGFTAIADQLADDYQLGALTRRVGLRTVLSDVVVETCVVERSYAALVRHELRWLRTIRALRPVSYCFCFVTFAVPVGALGALLTGGATAALFMLAVSGMARLLLHAKLRSTGSPVSHVLVVPVRDSLSLCLWAWSFATRRVQWREDRYRVGRDGSVQLVVRI